MILWIPLRMLISWEDIPQVTSNSRSQRRSTSNHKGICHLHLEHCSRRNKFLLLMGSLRLVHHQLTIEGRQLWENTSYSHLARHEFAIACNIDKALYLKRGRSEVRGKITKTEGEMKTCVLVLPHAVPPVCKAMFSAIAFVAAIPLVRGALIFK